MYVHFHVLRILSMNEGQWDSFFSIIWPRDPQVWKTHFCPEGAVKAWLLADTQTPLVSYLTEEV